MAKGLIDSLVPGRQRASKLDIQDAELWGEAIMAVNHPEHQARANTIWGGFAEVFKEGIAIPRWSQMGWGERLAHTPGQFASTLLKPFDMAAYVFGLDRLSDYVERLSRRGAYLSVIDAGGTPERAQLAYDKVSGNFIARGGSETSNALISTAMFLNAALQTTYQLYDNLTDPSKRGGTVMRLVMAGVSGAIIAMISRAMMDDDDTKKFKLQPLSERLKNMHIPVPGTDTVLRVPFAFGLEGGFQSWGYHLAMSRMLDEDVPVGTLATDTIKRALSFDAALELASPAAKLTLEYYSNKAAYDDRPIIPGYLTDELPEMQYGTRTTETAKKYGEVTGNSPMWVEHMVSSMLGRNLLAATRVIETRGAALQEISDIPSVGDLFAREPRGYNSRPVQEVYEQARRFEQARSVVQRLTDEGRSDDPRFAREKAVMSEYKTAYDAKLAIGKLTKAIRYEQGKDAPNRELIRKWERQMTAVAQWVKAAKR